MDHQMLISFSGGSLSPLHISFSLLCLSMKAVLSWKWMTVSMEIGLYESPCHKSSYWSKLVDEVSTFDAKKKETWS